MEHEKFPDTHHDPYSKTVFGFWVYILSDFMLFATIFAAYAVLSKSTFGGPSGKELFNLHKDFMQALILLVSSFTVGIGGAFAHRKNRSGTLIFFALTFLLGLGFMWMMGCEFSQIFSMGYDWKSTAFLSMFFTLTGMFGLHMIFALLWIVVLALPLCFHEITDRNIRRLSCLRMFWQFLNIVWVFIFSIVYLLGVI